MSRQSRRLATVKRLAQRYVDRQREAGKQTKAPQTEELIRKCCFYRVACVCLVCLYGDPKMDEPLIRAWERCIESDEMKLCFRKHGNLRDYAGSIFKERANVPMDPFYNLAVRHIAHYFYECVLPEISGSDSRVKFNRILAAAPLWLLWFTYMDWHARQLDLTVPDLSSVSRLVREPFPRSSTLPKGPLVAQQLPAGCEDPIYAARHNRPTSIALPDNLTRRERERKVRIYTQIGMRVANPDPDRERG